MLQNETRSAPIFWQHYQWNFDGVTDKHWFQGSPAISRWFDVYTLLVPDNEAFFIRTLVPCVARMGGESEKTEMRDFFRQEYLHGIAHKAYWRRMQQFGFRVDRFVRCVNWVLYSVFEPIQPRRLRVSIVAAIEHINASLGNIVLGKDLLGATSGELKKLYYWHFSEEIEHKAVAYKALKQCYPGYTTRVLGAAIAFPCFFILTFVGMTYFLIQDRQCFKLRTLQDLYRFWITGGVLRESATHLGRYLRISFEPWDLDDSYLALDNRPTSAPEGLQVVSGQMSPS
jgi:uncharacterized protein